jgi:hypothetical protein
MSGQVPVGFGVVRIARLSHGCKVMVAVAVAVVRVSACAVLGWVRWVEWLGGYVTAGLRSLAGRLNRSGRYHGSCLGEKLTSEL